MRNIFDQYTQPENKVTHALMTALSEDSVLLRRFLRWLDQDVSHRSLNITEQQIPGNPVAGEEGGASGLPDGCIYCESAGYSLMIESKIQSAPSIDQLRRHLKTAQRREFQDSYVVLISVDYLSDVDDPRITQIQWSQLYKWMGQSPKSFWAREFRRYLEVFESKADKYEIRGTLTMFDGIHFDVEQPYAYPEAKRLIRLLCDDLQADPGMQKLNIQLDGKRRSAITGKDNDSVWDFIPIAEMVEGEPFTKHPHLTVGIRLDCSNVSVTVPNGAAGVNKTLKELGKDGFVALLTDVAQSLTELAGKHKESKPLAYALQRHFLGQRSSGIEDAKIEFDLRAIVDAKDSKIKYQPLWVELMYELLAQKLGNLQMGISFQLPHSCEAARSARIKGVFIDAWLSMQPFLDAFR
jgi:hypothetical protein